jgi:hypothetical protein
MLKLKHGAILYERPAKEDVFAALVSRFNKDAVSTMYMQRREEYHFSVELQQFKHNNI